MDYEKMWTGMKSTYDQRLAKLESEGKKGGNAWINAKRFVDVMSGIELSQPVSDGMDDGYEKVGKVLSEGMHGEEIEFIQAVQAEKIIIKLKTGRTITIEIDSSDEDAVFSTY